MTTKTPKPEAFPTVQEFWDRLDKHDWYYEFSDDPLVWQKGLFEERKLTQIALQGNGEYRELYEGFKAHHFSGEPFPRPRVPKPPRP